MYSVDSPLFSLPIWPLVSDARTKYRKLVGDKIRQNRKKAHLTQEELAELVGIDSKYFGQVERGEETISLDKFIGIAKALKISAGSLLRGI